MNPVNCRSMRRINLQSFDTPCGELLLGSLDHRLCLCDWRFRRNRAQIDSRVKQGPGAAFVDRDDRVLQAARRQLDEYFRHRRKRFDLPLLMVGSAFQKTVWNALLEIPFGETTSYAELAAGIGNRNAVRAVASANGANAISIIIPCHRVVGSNGGLTGYAGVLEAKAKLLRLEFELAN